MAIFKSMFKKTGYIKIGSQPEEKEWRLYRMVCG